MAGKPEIIVVLRDHLQELFDIPPEKVTLDARLSEDLDLDSIDAVDLIVKLQEFTGRKIPPAEFKAVRTIGDVVDKLHAQLTVGA